MNTEIQYVELAELLRDMKSALEDCFPDRIWVKAEIASLQVRTNGHCYMDLVQSKAGRQVAKVKAVIWGSKFPMLAKFFEAATGSPLAPGQQVLVRAEVNFSELYGMSLIIDDVNPEFTLGDAERQRQETINALEAKGLMRLQKGLELAPLPYRLAVISAPDAAGFGDFRRHLLENEYGFVFDVELFEATMQGQHAPDSITAALTRASEAGADAILILRGGGSSLDLACFDDYSLAVAIATCAVPVFTAIGHDRDYHVADMVSYRFLKTPTALADEFIQYFADEDEALSALENRLRLAFVGRLSLMEARLDKVEQRIASGDPRAVLRRGFTLVADSRGRVVKSAAALHPGDSITILLADGSVVATVD